MSPPIPQDFIDQVVERSNLVEVIGAELELKKKSRDYQGLCPFHNEKTPSFSVSPHKGLYYCFGCGASGNVLSFLLNYKRLGFQEAVELLAERAGLPMPSIKGTGPRVDNRPLYELLSRAAHWFTRQLDASDAAQQYLTSRRVAPKAIKDFGIGYAPDSRDKLYSYLSADCTTQELIHAGLIREKSPQQRYDYFSHRLIFPIRDNRGRVVAFAGRVMSDQQQPKYLNSPNSRIFQKNQQLYGLDQALGHRSLKQLIFVEGYMDVIALTQAGIPGAVAAMGTAVTQTQIELAYRYVDDLVFCFDGDVAGTQAAWKTLERALLVLEGRKQIKFIFLPAGSDPDSWVHEEGSDAFKSLVEKAVNLSDFFFSHLKQDLDLSSIDGVRRLLANAAPLIKTIKDDVLRQLFDKQLEQLTGLKVSSVEKAIQPAARQSQATGAMQVGLLRNTLQQLVLAPSAANQLSPDETYPWLSELEGSDAVLLDKLMRALRARPTDKTAVLLARFSGQEEYPRLVQLSRTEIVLPDEDRQKDFLTGLKRLHKQVTRLNTSRMIERKRMEQEEITPEQMKAIKSQDDNGSL